MSKRLWLIGAIALVVIAITATVLVIVLREKGTTTAAPPPEPTVWQRIEMGTDKDGVMGLEPALQSFAYLFGTMPGVAQPSGKPDAPGFAVSGSGPLRWVMAHWDKLTEEHREQVRRVLTIPPDVQRFSGGAPDKERARQTLQDEVSRLQQEIGKRLGLTIPPVKVFPSDLEVNAKTRAWTVPLAEGDEPDENGRHIIGSPGDGPAVRCNVYVPPSMWTNVSGGIAPEFQQTLAHEITHCFQGHTYPTVGQYLRAPGWIIEGGADFAGTDVTHTAPQIIWQLYLSWIDSLLKRTYTAMGWWFHVQHKGHDPWKAFATIWKGAQDTAAAYRTAHGDADDVYDTYASSFLRSEGFGEAWQVHGIGVPAQGAPPLERRDASNGSVPVAAYDNRVAVLEVAQPNDTIVRLKADKPVRLHDSGRFEQVRTTAGDYCTGGECVCPQKTKKAGQRIQRVEPSIYLGVPGGESGNAVSTSTMSLMDYCQKEDEEKNSCTSRFTAGAEQPGCGSEAGSNGEPHLTSFDGREFDFQAGGEFTLARSDSGDLEIQSRQEALRWNGQENLAISVNTAVAARVGPDRVGVYPGNEGLKVRINGGPPAEVPEERRLPGGGSVAAHSNGYDIRWPDGTALTVVPIGEFGLNVITRPAPSRLNTLHGMLGPFEGVEKNPAMQDRGGKRYDAPNPDTLYKVIGESWRITQADSLFDYAPGQSTDTFTRREMPNRLITLKDLEAERKTAGEAACAAITDTKLREQCVFDVALTGDKRFADGYKSVERIINRGGIQDGATVRGDIAKPEEVDSYQVDLAAGEEFRIAEETEDLKVTLAGPEEQVLPGTINGLAVTSFRVKTSGTYQLRVARDTTGPYGFRFVMIKPRRTDARIGDQLTAHLDLPGRVEQFALDSGDAGEFRVLAENCEDIWFGIDEDGPELNPGQNLCKPGHPHTFTVEPGKRYVFVVWSGAARTGNVTFRTERA